MREERFVNEDVFRLVSESELVVELHRRSSQTRPSILGRAQKDPRR